jgi:hypothetical protein
MLLAVVCSIALLAAPLGLISYLAGRSGVDLSGPRQEEVRYNASYIRLDEAAHAVATTASRLSGSTVAFQQAAAADRPGSVVIWESFPDEPSREHAA